MKKIISIGIFGIIVGVIISGSGSAISISPEEVASAQKNGVVYFGMENNASFLAPMPINLGYSYQFYEQPIFSNVLKDTIIFRTSD